MCGQFPGEEVVAAASCFMRSRGDRRTSSGAKGEEEAATRSLLLAGLPEVPLSVDAVEGGERFRGRFRGAGRSGEAEYLNLFVGVTSKMGVVSAADGDFLFLLVGVASADGDLLVGVATPEGDFLFLLVGVELS